MNKTASTMYISLILIGLLWPGVIMAQDKQWNITAESGMILPGYNDVQIPPESGTLISLKDDLDLPATAFLRLRLTWQWHSRHAFSLLYAPLSLTASGTLPTAVHFAGENFAPQSQINATFRFNSYRLTYRYTLVNRPKFKLGIGFTAKIRDAEISLRDGLKEGKKTDVGFVPLLNLVIDWRWNPRWSLLLEADALAAPGGQGRAEDVALALRYTLSPTWNLQAGYRLVEGGADVDTVYNFAWINYLFVGIGFSW